MVGVNTPGPCWTKTLKSLEPPLQYIENFQSPPFNARKYFGAPPLTSSSPPLGIINVLSLRYYCSLVKKSCIYCSVCPGCTTHTVLYNILCKHVHLQGFFHFFLDDTVIRKESERRLEEQTKTTH